MIQTHCSECNRSFLTEVWGANWCKCHEEWRCNACYTLHWKGRKRHEEGTRH